MYLVSDISGNPLRSGGVSYHGVRGQGSRYVDVELEGFRLFPLGNVCGRGRLHVGMY